MIWHDSSWETLVCALLPGMSIVYCGCDFGQGENKQAYENKQGRWHFIFKPKWRDNNACSCHHLLALLLSSGSAPPHSSSFSLLLPLPCISSLSLSSLSLSLCLPFCALHHLSGNRQGIHHSLKFLEEAGSPKRREGAARRRNLPATACLPYIKACTVSFCLWRYGELGTGGGDLGETF